MRKNNGINLLLLAVVLVMQGVLLFAVSPGSLLFSAALDVYDSFLFTLLVLLYEYLPIPFVLFVFMGWNSDLVSGYGKLLIIRSYGRNRLCLKEIGKILAGVCGIVVVQWLISLVGGVVQEDNAMEWTWNSLWIVLLYALGLFVIVLFQFSLELVTEAENANLVTNILVVVSIFIGNTVISEGQGKWLLCLFFPNLLYAKRNGTDGTDGVGMIVALAVLLVWMAMLVVFSLRRFRRRDIY